MKIEFSDVGWQQYQQSPDIDFKGLRRLNMLIEECRRNPFTGTGKPEPLKGNYRGWWSLRINQTDRLVCRISGKPPEQTLEIVQCRGSY